MFYAIEGNFQSYPLLRHSSSTHFDLEKLLLEETNFWSFIRTQGVQFNVRRICQWNFNFLSLAAITHAYFVQKNTECNVYQDIYIEYQTFKESNNLTHDD